MRHLLWLLAALVVSPTWAFGFNGHKAFCQAAYELTSPKTQQALDKVVASQGKYGSFAESCTWADDIKGDHHWDWSKPLHYVNIPRGASKLTDANCPATGCVLSGIRHYQALLTQNPNDWQALFFLSHFIGDLHQPLHVSYADDLGGNRALGQFFGEEKNLHGIWDYGMLGHMGGDDWKGFGHKLAGLANAKDAGGTPLAWGNQSMAITQQVYRYYQGHKTMGQEYVDHFGPVLEQRMEAGAERLAKVLDSIYDK
ncbi:S1/P1 nuclease [Gallaecimonas xiamenensis]|uniref:Endonuclease n=1 Tax=Gallaecimonas xiamenensis 3-C-1 TaxID=745411 RepID=K2J1I2_9GAMM|nr:S1/P1 nuclease [Gallaecimonas xiamenensis]EKE68647.1 endonuclease [Gallaecimonas xiamenensis 3-C-1]